MTDHKPNYDESLVPEYTLPDPLVMEDGTPVTTPEQWQELRRPEILRLFQEHMYGRPPGRPEKVSFEVVAEYREAILGGATRKEIVATFENNGRSHQMEIIVYLPNAKPGPHPIFVGLNFFGNHSITDDADIRLSGEWMMGVSSHCIVDDRATEASRGIASRRWPIARVLTRGYGIASIYCGDLDPDFDDGFQNGIHPLFYREGQTKPDPDEWGTIGAWAWGLSRAADYFEGDDEIDHRRVAVMGHSRLGKTALWAGAQDERFAIVISNDSGCGGAALARRRFGETVEVINNAFPHWFCDNHKRYSGREDDLPVDQHQLIALMAPRPVYIASAANDLWADPKGEFLSGVHAGPVYKLLGKTGLGTAEHPQPGGVIADGDIGYHLRPGDHDVLLWDWERFMDFADRHYDRNNAG